MTGEDAGDSLDGAELSTAVRRATMRLAQAGVVSAPVDALLLAAHLLGVDSGEARRLMVLRKSVAPQGFDELVAERARRVPLQHLTGRAPFRRVELRVGPGVFVPRPETETLVELALGELSRIRELRSLPTTSTGSTTSVDPANPAVTVVDLATGSGAIALAIADEAPSVGVDATVHAVELSEQAHAWALANRERLGLPVDLRLGDATAAFDDLVGAVDLVTCNPPYIPLGQVPLDPEVREHDPQLALYGGSDDGLAIPLAMAARAAALLRDDGVLLTEHADAQGVSLPRALSATGDWGRITDHVDLAGRPRVVRVVRAVRA